MRRGRFIWLSLCPLLITIGYTLFHTSEYLRLQTVSKDSILNSVFVKRGWFWTTLVLWYTILRTRLINKKRFAIRYALVTLWWLFFTQGVNSMSLPPIMDLWFVYTGGYCSFDVFGGDDNVATLNNQFQDSHYRKLSALKKIYKLLNVLHKNYIKQEHVDLVKCGIDHLNNSSIDCSATTEHNTNSIIRKAVLEFEPMVNYSSARCRQNGGHWTGGHDPSGHIFMLTLLIMLIGGELPKIIAADYSNRLKKKPGQVNTFTLWSHSFFKLFDNGPFWNVFNNHPQTIPQYLYQIFVKPIETLTIGLIEFIYFTMMFIVWENPVMLLLILDSMWCYSYLITTIIFHTVYEQVTGFICAYVVIVAIYQFCK